MGLFKKKREPESPPAGGQMKSFEDGNVPWAADRESVGQQVEGQTQGIDFTSMGQMGTLFQQMQEAQAAVTMDASTDPQAIAAGNAEMGERIKQVMRKYGVDPEVGATNIDPSQMMAMQQEMMQVMSGADSSQLTGDPGETPKFDIQMSEPIDSDDPGS